MKLTLALLVSSLLAFATSCSSTSRFQFREEGKTPPLMSVKDTQSSEEITPLTTTSFRDSDEYSPAVVGENLVAFVSTASGQLDIWYVDHVDTNRREDAELVATSANEKAPFVVVDAASKKAKCYFVTDASGSFQIFSGSLPKITSQTSELTAPGDANWPDISHDGKRLLYSVVNAAERYEVWIREFETGRTTRIVEGQRARWNPSNSNEFAYVGEENGTWSIWRIDLVRNAPVRLQQGEGDSFDPSWSPDGRFIAYTSNRTGNSDIWIMNSDGANARQKTTHGAIDCQPAWTEDGESLIFASNRGESFDIYKMSVVDVVGPAVTP